MNIDTDSIGWQYAVGVLVISLLMSGCVQNESLTHTSEKATTVTQSPAPGGEQLREAEIDITVLELNNYSGNSTVSMQIQVISEVRGFPEATYDDPRLCLYDANGDVLANKSFGSIISPGSGEFRDNNIIKVRTSERPKYITVDHPELRKNSMFRIKTLVWNSERTVWQLSTDGPSLPFSWWPRTNESGRCG